ncbi:FAD-dependent oxidoreductase [Kineosporia sp. R_H_3]|uniref:FAD-dependent oxidoreductase n=1 Tax=Kineosporia sp. R_H_3 TaxID=1961848 RepID=UPI0013044031|nr:FAD-dependent oxidoreductase [Kineosporia sp. R_H_3]
MLDAVVVGGGAAGLSLAARLATDGWGDRRVLVVDEVPLDHDRSADRSWGWWSAQHGPVEAAAERAYDSVAVVTDRATRLVDLAPYRYRVVSLRALRAVTAAAVARTPGIEIVRARASEVVDGREGARVVVDGETVEAAWVFDSTGTWPGRRPGARGPRPAGAGHRMRFTGWEVRTYRNAFDPDVAVLCDARLPGGRAAFVHVLPQDRRTALVEHTAYVPPGVPGPIPAEAGQELTAYLRGVLAAGRFRVGRVEHGTIDLRPRAPHRRGRRVLAVGAAGGLVRASSGYGFGAIQRDAAAVVRSLVEHGHPFAVPHRPWRHRWLDAVFLRALAREPAVLGPAFVAMFGGDDPLRVLRFLDDGTTWADDARLVRGLPVRPFMRALGPGGGVQEHLLHPPVPRDDAEHGRHEHRDGLHPRR